MIRVQALCNPSLEALFLKLSYQQFAPPGNNTLSKADVPSIPEPFGDTCSIRGWGDSLWPTQLQWPRVERGYLKHTL